VNRFVEMTLDELGVWQRGLAAGVALERKKWLHPWSWRRYHWHALVLWAKGRPMNPKTRT
jgi:hypothetical protein